MSRPLLRLELRLISGILTLPQFEAKGRKFKKIENRSYTPDGGRHDEIGG
jgi:hypothetical protein